MSTPLPAVFLAQAHGADVVLGPRLAAFDSELIQRLRLGDGKGGVHTLMYPSDGSSGGSVVTLRYPHD